MKEPFAYLALTVVTIAMVSTVRGNVSSGTVTSGAHSLTQDITHGLPMSEPETYYDAWSILEGFEVREFNIYESHVGFGDLLHSNVSTGYGRPYGFPTRYFRKQTCISSWSSTSPTDSWTGSFNFEIGKAVDGTKFLVSAAWQDERTQTIQQTNQYGYPLGTWYTNRTTLHATVRPDSPAGIPVFDGSWVTDYGEPGRPDAISPFTGFRISLTPYIGPNYVTESFFYRSNPQGVWAAPPDPWTESDAEWRVDGYNYSIALSDEDTLEHIQARIEQDRALGRIETIPWGSRRYIQHGEVLFESAGSSSDVSLYNNSSNLTTSGAFYEAGAQLRFVVPVELRIPGVGYRGRIIEYFYPSTAPNSAEIVTIHVVDLREGQWESAIINPVMRNEDGRTVLKSFSAMAELIRPHPTIALSMPEGASASVPWEYGSTRPTLVWQTQVVDSNESGQVYRQVLTGSVTLQQINLSDAHGSLAAWGQASAKWSVLPGSTAAVRLWLWRDDGSPLGTWQQLSADAELKSYFGNDTDFIFAELMSPGSASVRISINIDGQTVHDDLRFDSLSIGLAVDANRDGVIKLASEDSTDSTSAAQPYRFWLNDDDDNSFQEARWSDSDPEFYPARRPDSSNQIIDSPRDCEDLNRLWIDATGLIDALKDTSNELHLGLRWKNTLGGHPSIRLFKGVDSSGGLGHIQNVLVAAEQTTGGLGDTTSAKACLGDADASNNMSPSAEQPLIYYPWSGITTVEPPTDVGSIRAADFIFRTDALSQIFGNRPTGYLLFEGVKEGKGELEIVVVRKKSDGTWEKVLDGGSVWLQLDNIRRMYVRAHATPTDADFPLPWQVTNPPTWPYEESAVSTEQKALSIPESRLSYAVGDSLESSSSYPFSPSPDEQAKGVVYVHGIDLNVPTQQGYAQSFFKRLWWGGYRGRFIVFRWSTPLSDGIADTPYGWDQEGSSIYNSGEYRAFKGGTSLRKFVQGLRTPGNPFYVGANVTIGLAAHSQGNIVAGEALRQGMLVNSYVAMEAAVPLSCYYAPGDQPPTVPRLLEAEAQYLTKFTTSYYQGYFQSIGGAVKTSYHNANDFWLVSGRLSPLFLSFEANWIRNNEAYKPDDPPGSSRYQFDLLEGPAYNRGTGVLRGISDPHELLAYVSRALTLPLGAADDPPQFSGNTDLAADYGFAAQRPDHSGQFQRDIQYMYGNASGVPWRAADGSQQPFYQRLMRDLGIQP